MCGGSPPSDTTSTVKPFPEQEKALTRLFGMAQESYDQGPMEFFPDSTVAAQADATLQGQQAALDAAAPQAALGMAGARSVAAALDPTSEQSQAVINPFISRLQGQILPGIGSRAIQQGAFGGDRQRIQEQQAAEATAGAATQAMLRNQLAAMSALPRAQSALLSPSRTLSAVGAQQQAYDQALINAARQRFAFEQQAPETALDRLASRLTGVNLGQIGTTSGGGGGGSDLASALGLGLGAYGLFGGKPGGTPT
jgi:hypothetical protein